MLVALTTAVRAREVLRFDHRSEHTSDVAGPGKTTPPRRVEPVRAAGRSRRRRRRRLRERPVHGLLRRRRLALPGVIELDLPPAAVAPYPPDGVVEALDPDRCRLALGAGSWVGLAATLARLDAEIRVVSPPELQEAFGVLADRRTRTAHEHR